MLLPVFVKQVKRFLLLHKELKGKIVLQHSMQYQDWIQNNTHFTLSGTDFSTLNWIEECINT